MISPRALLLHCGVLGKSSRSNSAVAGASHLSARCSSTRPSLLDESKHVAIQYALGHAVWVETSIAIHLLANQRK